MEQTIIAGKTRSLGSIVPLEPREFKSPANHAPSTAHWAFVESTVFGMKYPAEHSAGSLAG
jgi:hypothetical protein